MAALRRQVAAVASADDGAAVDGRFDAVGVGVLSVKLGFNPNSSSVGSLVSVLFWSATGAAVLANLVAAALLARRAQAALPAPAVDPAGKADGP